MPQFIVDGSPDKVWVNGELGCVARFCKVSHEVLARAKDVDKPFAPIKTWLHKDRKPSVLDWNAFVRRVERKFGVRIDPRYRPSYVVG
jgi:hypothetical protein